MVEAIVGVALRAILASVLLGSVLAGLVALATRTLALTAATRHALWTTALIATGLMPLAGVAVSVARAVVIEPEPVVTRYERPAVTVAPRPVSKPAREPSGVAASSAPATKSTTTWPERLAFVRSTPRMSRTLAAGAAIVWAVGALIGLFGLAASIIRVRGLKKRSSPLDGPLADELPWLTEARSGREIYLRLSYETETPVAIGFRRPVILIPTELATAEGLSGIEPLVMHEHAHLRRLDDWTNLVQRVIERIFWFNPIVWIVGRRIALEREIASDDAVVERTGAAHAYATSLWRLAREMRMPEHAVVAPGALLTRKQITVRIEQLLDKNRSRLHRSPGAALAVAVAGALAVAFVASSAPAVELPAPAAPVEAANVALPAATTAPASPRAAAHVAHAAAVDAPHRSVAAVATAAPVAPAALHPAPVATTRVVTEHRIVYDATRTATATAAPTATAPSPRAMPAVPPLPPERYRELAQRRADRRDRGARGDCLDPARDRTRDRGIARTFRRRPRDARHDRIVYRLLVPERRPARDRPARDEDRRR